MKKFDVAIIGGGVIGSNILYMLSKYKLNVVLLEAECDVGMGASGANSGIIHAGYDCKPYTFKAKMNLRGNALFEDLCKDIDVKFKRCGSLVVGKKDDKETIEKLYAQGIISGVRDMSIINKEQLRHLEPNVSEDMEIALYCKSAGVVSSYELSYAMCSNAIENGCTVNLNFKVEKISQNGKYYLISSKDGAVVSSQLIINCSGSGFNAVNTIAGAELYPVTYRRGEYYILDKSQSNLISKIIFPVPNEAGKGVLCAPTVCGNILLGPNAEYVENGESSATTKQGLDFVKASVQKTVNGIDFSKVIKIYAGVRCISGEDFIIRKSKRLKNYITVGGICSPGLTSSPAIAEMVEKMLAKEIMLKPKNKIIKRWAINRDDKDMMRSLIANDASYGKIICKCENISLGEIKRIMNLPLPPTTVDGLKRRLRASMGRCQGSFCKPMLSEIIKSYNEKRKVTKK